jgi:hypothetical protein
MSTTDLLKFREQRAALDFDFQNWARATYSDFQRGYKLGGKKLDQAFGNDETCRNTFGID